MILLIYLCCTNPPHPLILLHVICWPRMRGCSQGFPDATSIILASRDDKITLIIKGAAEYLIGVALKRLQALSALCVP